MEKTSLHSVDTTELNSTEMSTILQLEKNVAYLMKRLDGQSASSRDNVSIRNRYALDAELRAVPLTLRILESQVCLFFFMNV